ncbi:hypothetical protein [Klebsiella pneumoniae]|uniref:hypothetical protein n=1 Tax=Klebsiella pneumoniae TaxID=573 RepID=UPI0021669D43|nr:hypothetical protein [Klebsiella pneumoniae]
MNISEQYRVAVVSTGHVKKEDAELLDKVCSGSRKIAMGGYCVFLLLNNGEWN